MKKAKLADYTQSITAPFHIINISNGYNHLFVLDLK